MWRCIDIFAPEIMFTWELQVYEMIVSCEMLLGCGEEMSGEPHGREGSSSEVVSRSAVQSCMRHVSLCILAWQFHPQEPKVVAPKFFVVPLPCNPSRATSWESSHRQFFTRLVTSLHGGTPLQPWTSSTRRVKQKHQKSVSTMANNLSTLGLLPSRP